MALCWLLIIFGHDFLFSSISIKYANFSWRRRTQTPVLARSHKAHAPQYLRTQKIPTLMKIYFTRYIRYFTVILINA